MDDKTTKHLIALAQEEFDGFEIDWTKYDKGELIFDDDEPTEVVWKHLEHGLQIILTSILFGVNKRNEWSILQRGSNYGNLSL